MKSLTVGSRVRLAPRVWGTVVALDGTHAHIRWTKIKGVRERVTRMSFIAAEIVPDADPLTASVPWRLRYWMQDGHGAANAGLMSAGGDDKQPKWWQPYTPLP